MRNRRWIFWVVALLNIAAQIVYVAVFVKQDVVAVHYGLDGQANRWGSKWELAALSLLPLLMLALYELYRKLAKNPRNLKNRKYEDVYIPLIAMMFIPIGWLMTTIRGERLAGGDIGWLGVFMGIMMVVISNIMGKISPNRYFGYRLPWTLKDDEVWIATHRRAGYWGVAGGITMILSGLLALRFGYGFAIAGLILGIVVMTAPPAVFAYRMYHERHPR